MIRIYFIFTIVITHTRMHIERNKVSLIQCTCQRHVIHSHYLNRTQKLLVCITSAFQVVSRVPGMANETMLHIQMIMSCQISMHNIPFLEFLVFLKGWFTQITHWFPFPVSSLWTRYDRVTPWPRALT